MVAEKGYNNGVKWIQKMVSNGKKGDKIQMKNGYNIQKMVSNGFKPPLSEKSTELSSSAVPSLQEALPVASSHLGAPWNSNG